MVGPDPPPISSLTSGAALRKPLVALLLLLAPLTACRSGVIYPERMYEESLALTSQHENTGGLRRDVRKSLERRLKTVVRWAEEGKLETESDLGWAAMTLTLSDREEHLEKARKIANAAAELGDPRGGVAYAHATDKLAFHRGDDFQPYGTNFAYVHVIGRFEIKPPVDPRTSDSERRALGVPSLAELQAMGKEINATAETTRLREEIMRH